MKFIQNCVKDTIKTLKQPKYFNSSIAFRDYGKFGSGTCQSINCLKVAQELRLDENLAALGVKVQEFKPLLLKGQSSTSISANVEQEVLAQTDFLVTIGYGSFQRGVVHTSYQHVNEELKFAILDFV